MRGEGGEGILPVWQDAVPLPSPVLHSGTSSENSTKVVFTLKIRKIYAANNPISSSLPKV
jgi:hypothetical protein